MHFMGQLVGRYIWLILLGIFSAQQELVVFSQTEWLIWARSSVGSSVLKHLRKQERLRVDRAALDQRKTYSANRSAKACASCLNRVSLP
jgi:hypothetical protein